MPSAFVFEKQKFDVSGVTAFGDLKYVFSEGDRRSSVFQSDKFIEDIVTRLSKAGYTAKTDAVVATGSLIPVLGLAAAATRCAQAQGSKTVNFLLYDSRSLRYFLSTVNI